jgi:PIN domain
MAFVVLYDACVLYPAPLRDLLVRLANTGVVRARWSGMILDECFRNILEHRPDLKAEALERTRELMTRAVPDCMVTNFDALIDGLLLPDVDDRHVLAAAIRAGAGLGGGMLSSPRRQRCAEASKVTCGGGGRRSSVGWLGRQPPEDQKHAVSDHLGRSLPVIVVEHGRPYEL